MPYEHLTVFAGLNQVSAGLNWFKPHVWQKQDFAGRNPTLAVTHLVLAGFDVHVDCYCITGAGVHCVKSVKGDLQSECLPTSVQTYIDTYMQTELAQLSVT